MNTVVFTSLTLNYLPKAQVLARSLKRHNPELRFCLAVAEPVSDDLKAIEPAIDEVLTVDDLPIPDRETWLFRHSRIEMCTAIKSIVLEHLLERPSIEAVIYLDPDMAVFAPLTPVLAELETADVVLTPHLCEPETEPQAILDNEMCALRHGVYNLGFLAVADRPEGRRFARWWKDRLEHFCRDDIARGLFTDQRWIDLVPAFFPTCKILRHPGCNAATWNLTRRRVEGDFDRGFAVNGLPLVFYHFSGFDNGAQGGMLLRYGADQPALFRLRHWYVEETARVDKHGFRRRRWRYDTYDNGEPIRPEHRAGYWDRADVRPFFPHPFAAAGNSYWAWCQAHLPAPPEPPSNLAGATPLERYLSDGSLFRVAPHPWFDGDYYLQSNPEVARGLINPLLHYVCEGESGNRPPHPDFDPEYVRKIRMLAPGASPLAEFEKSGRQGWTNPRHDPRQDQAAIDKMRALLNPDLPLILFIGHDGKGGVGLNVRRLIHGLAGRADGALISGQPSGWIELSLPENPESPMLGWNCRDITEGLCAAIRRLGPSRIRVHHWIFNEIWLGPFLRAIGLPYDITLHDYHFLAPQPHLLNERGEFAGDDRLNDEILARPAWKGAPPCSLAEWRAEARPILEGAARIFAPSRDLANRYRRVFENLPIHVVPHWENPRPETLPATLRRCLPNEPLKVLWIGQLSPHKGLRILEACAALAKKSGAPIVFEALGAIRGEPPANVRMHGAYEPDEVDRRIREIQPHLAWFPAQCPESYSHTLSEAMRCGLPILASELGSLPERLGGRPLSWVFPWDAAPEAWLARLREIRERHFVQGEPAPPAGSPPDWDTSFYPDGCLNLSYRRTT